MTEAVKCIGVRIAAYRVIVLAILLVSGLGCPYSADPFSADLSAAKLTPVWVESFTTTEFGSLSAVWGSAPDDVFAVGGPSEQAWVLHYDGADWMPMDVPQAPQMIWVYGFGPGDVYAAGLDGAVIHYDGEQWTSLESGTDEDLWGVWGAAPDDLWFVGGEMTPGDPVILHFDGDTFTPSPMPQNDRNATSLFKVWGIGSKVFAVGSKGLIIEYNGQEWVQVPSGPAANDDIIALWGTSEDNIVAVGGRANGLVSAYDGQSWTTQNVAPAPGISAVFMTEPGEAIVAGQFGYVGNYDPVAGLLTEEPSPTTHFIHGVWGDGEGVFYAVGTEFVSQTQAVGFMLVRTLESAGN